MKKKYNLYEYIEIDTKDISDIEKYWPQMRSLGLPRYEHTARDVRTVGTWYAYSEINDTSNAGIFANYLLDQLDYYGVDTKRVGQRPANLM